MSKKKAAVNRALSIVRKYFPGVNKVNDAKAGLTVEVTANDDKVSRRKDHMGCAMAVACKRKMKLDGVIISTNRAYMIKGDTATRFYVPESVAREVVSFDRGSGFNPGTYKLDKPSVLLGEAHHGGNTLSGRGQLKTKVAHHLTENIRGVLGHDRER